MVREPGEVPCGSLQHHIDFRIVHTYLVRNHRILCSPKQPAAVYCGTSVAKCVELEARKGRWVRTRAGIALNLTCSWHRSRSRSLSFYPPMPARHIPALNSSSRVYLERRNYKATLSSDVYGRRQQNIGHIKTKATFRDSSLSNVYTNCIQNSLLLAPYHYC